MAIGKDRAVLRQLRTLFNVGAIGDLTDGQLLERFAGSRGEAAELAFAVLVERHGPMVLRVCRGVLVDPHDREDAFQATFLVLVKKARALWVRDSLGPWLHQVAYRTASRARSAAARRRRHERRAALARQESRDELGDELGRVLHEELDRLPERYRAPVVLCDLEGCSHEQAARHLGWPVGTVKSRQARGRERLRDRLRRRGLAPNAGLLATALSGDGHTALLPPALVDSTTKAVVQFVTWFKKGSGTVAGTARRVLRTTVPDPFLNHGSAASLAHGVLRSMLITRWLKVASLLLALGATVSGAGLLAQNGKAGDPPRSKPDRQAARAYDGPVHEVKPGKLLVNEIAPGTLESSRNQDVFCMVEGQTTIISIVPEGTYNSKKGEFVCKLDSARLEDELVNQTLVVQRAEADWRNAKLAREAAEIAVTEYRDVYNQEQTNLRGTIDVAQLAMRQAEGRLERARHARKPLNDALAAIKGTRTSADVLAELDIEDRVDAAELTRQREKMSLEQAKSRRELHERYTRAKTTKKLEADVERKRGEELTKKSAVDLEKKREAKLNRQIAACTLVAPGAGIVVFANDPERRGTPPAIEEGATVRERQKIFSVPDLSHMQVNTRVRELWVDQLKRGMKARIRVDAFSDQVLEGTVVDVAPLPASSYFSSGIKIYPTKVRIDQPLPKLRPGMNADVEIVIRDLDNVLTVPIQAVLSYVEKNQVAVKKPDGRFEWRDVTLGPSSDTLVEVKKGVQSGDQVVLDPLSLFTDKERATLKAKTWPVPKPARERREVE